MTKNSAANNKSSSFRAARKREVIRYPGKGIPAYCAGMTTWVLVLSLLLARTCPAAYPDRPVRFVVPVAPGGAVDVVGRIVGHKFSTVLAQNFVVDNRPGATPEEFAKFIRTDLQKYAEIAKKAAIQPQ